MLMKPHTNLAMTTTVVRAVAIINERTTNRVIYESFSTKHQQQLIYLPWLLEYNDNK